MTVIAKFSHKMWYWLSRKKIIFDILLKYQHFCKIVKADIYLLVIVKSILLESNVSLASSFFCRKRRAFSKQYHIELEEARKAIEEAKWKRGIPDETKFDQHMEEAALRREQRKRNEVEFIYSSNMSITHYSTVLGADYDLASMISHFNLFILIHLSIN